MALRAAKGFKHVLAVRRKSCQRDWAADRAGPLRDYCTGLIVSEARKSVEPMAAITAPGRTAAQHQSLLHFVGQGPWSDAVSWPRFARWCCRRLSVRTNHGLDYRRHGIPKKGQHSVGVAHQYCGQLGKQANCQVAVSLSIANHAASLPVAYRLYLTKDWARTRHVGSRRRCQKISASRPSRRSRSSISIGV